MVACLLLLFGGVMADAMEVDATEAAVEQPAAAGTTPGEGEGAAAEKAPAAEKEAKAAARSDTAEGDEGDGDSDDEDEDEFEVEKVSKLSPLFARSC